MYITVYVLSGRLHLLNDSISSSTWTNGPCERKKSFNDTKNQMTLAITTSLTDLTPTYRFRDGLMIRWFVPPELGLINTYLCLKLILLLKIIANTMFPIHQRCVHKNTQTPVVSLFVSVGKKTHLWSMWTWHYWRYVNMLRIENIIESWACSAIIIHIQGFIYIYKKKKKMIERRLTVK